LATATISSRRESVFPRATEEVKDEHTEIKNHLGSGLVVREGEASHQRAENGGYLRFNQSLLGYDASWW
jgi:hypothetical protein